MTTPTRPRGPLFWILLVTGIGVAGCCFMSAAVLALGALADDTESTANAGGGGEWLVAGEIARGTTLTQSLGGGRWVAQYGSIVNSVVGRAGNTEWVQTNSSGSLYEFIFDDDGTYVLNWVSSVTLQGMKSSSHSTEKGSWSLSGGELTLTPASQYAEYSNGSGTQEKTDMDLRERQYVVVDLTLETLNDPKVRIPGVSMMGPKADWDTGSGEGVRLTLQRLSK